MAKTDLYRKRLGKHVRTMRTRHKLSVRGLASAVGLDPSAISRIENGEREPKLSTIAKLAEVFDQTANEFIASVTERV